MTQTLAQNLLHIVFSTKERRFYLQNADLRARLHAYMAGTLRGLDSTAMRIGGTSDHVHILCSLSPKRALSDVVRDVKTSSSKWAKQEGVESFAWQAGFSAFSVSASNADQVEEYIANQERHHAKLDFKAELKFILEKNGVGYDERYLFD